jgi:phosphotriesterase-related protein
VIFCHQDGSGADVDYQRELLSRGINLEYDLFGFEMAFVAVGKLRQWPTDTQRIEELRRLIDDGYISQLFISQDICTKCQLRDYGGWGYAHILETLPSRFAVAGISHKDLEMLMVENPRRLLTLRER